MGAAGCVPVGVADGGSGTTVEQLAEAAQTIATQWRPEPRTRKGVEGVHLVSLDRVRDVMRSEFWLVPALCVVAAIGLGAGLIAVDHALPWTSGAAFLYPGPPAGARSYLSSIVTAMIAFTGLVFSITIVVLQLTSGQFSPRVLRMFLSDRTIQFTLGVFVATFVYALVVQRAVLGDDTQSVAVPRIAVTMAFVFVLASVGLFIRYIDHMVNMIRVASIIDAIADESRTLLERLYPPRAEVLDPTGPLPEATRHVPAPRPGVLVSVNESGLARLATDAGCVITLCLRVGDFTPVGAPLFTVNGDPDDFDSLAARACRQVALDIERTMEQDLAFGFRQLIDIAERALSPSVNDPTTACQSIDALHDLLRRLATRPNPPQHVSASDGALGLIVPRYRFADLLALTVGEIWHYGREAAQVPARLAAMLADLTDAARPEHRAAVAHWAQLLAAAGALPSTGSSSDSSGADRGQS